MVKLEISIDRYIPTLMDFLRKRLTNFHEASLMTSLFRVMYMVLSDYKDTDTRHLTQFELNQVDDAIDSIFIYSVIWSLGVVLDVEPRRVFET